MSLEALIQETAKKVIANLQDKPASQGTPQAQRGSNPVTTTCGNVIIVLDGTGEVCQEAVNQIQSLASSGVKGQVVLSKGVNPNSVNLAGFELIAPDTYLELSKEAVIYIPHLTVGLAGKVANLIEDEAASRVVVRGLINQNKIFAGVSELDLLVKGKQRLTFGLSQRLKEYQRLLKAYDLVMINDLSQLMKACNATGTPALVTSGTAANPVSTPAQASCNCATSGCEGCGQCVTLNQTGVQQVIQSGADRVSSTVGATNSQVGGMIDHTFLKPDGTEADIRKLCAEAAQYKFASVCVNPGYVSLASQLLRGSGVKVCTVIGFPLGATTSTTKAMETRDAIANGATEIDMVINVGALKSGNNGLVKKDIEAVVEAARGQAIVKVILETSLLTDEEKVRACLLCKYAGADFVKTATGFGPGGATIEDIALMRKTVGAEMGVKASGGVRDFKTAQAMIQAGASRIGASASVAIVKGDADSGQGY